jgi:DNA-directed RNA polymerase specialized sigma24 family protein
MEVRVGQADADQEYTEFVAARLGRLHRLAYLLTGDVHRADDVVAQALMDVYLTWRRVRASDNPDGYVRTMVVRAFLHERRRAWSARVILTTETPERAAPPTEVEDASVLRGAGSSAAAPTGCAHSSIH